MRLIDGDVLIKELRTWDWQELYLPTHFQQLIYNAPTIDAVEVVRCKECEHGHPIETGQIRCYRTELWHMNYEENDFCSYGERREDD